MFRGRSITIFFCVRFSKFLSLKIMKVVTFNWKKDLKEIPSLLFKLDTHAIRITRKSWTDVERGGGELQREQLQGL